MNKKVLSAIIAAALAVSPIAVFAQDADTADINATAVISQQTNTSAFASSTMTVTAVENGTVVLRGEDESDIVNLTVTDDTLIIDSTGARVEGLSEGDSITYFVNGSKPAPLVLPPVYEADVIVVNEKDGENNSAVKVDIFKSEDGAFLSADKELALNLDPTVLENADGSKVTKESLEGRALCVIYSMTTMSIPAQTSPDKVYILKEADEYEEPAESSVAPEVTGTISVNGADAFSVDLIELNGRQMLPVRAVSEALGLQVSYDDELQAVTVGTVPMGVSFNIGTDSYTKSRMTPASLGQAPIKVIFEETGVTYVPVEFFSDILECNITTDHGITLINRQ